MSYTIGYINKYCAKSLPEKPMPPINKVEKMVMRAEQGEYLATQALVCLYRFHTATTPAEIEVDGLIEYTLDTIVEGFKDDRLTRN